MSAIQKIIDDALGMGLTAIINPRPGSNHRVKITNGDSRAVPSYPIIIDGKKFSIAGARQFLSGKNRIKID